MAKIIREVVKLCRQTFDPKINIEVVVCENTAVMGNTSLLQQVFLNLCLNARDALVERHASLPVIRLEVVHSDPDASAPQTRPGPHIYARVWDNGTSMAEETRQQVFEPFFTTKGVARGTGLGLSTAFAIVQQHGGWMHCHSEPDVGTTFYVHLPLSTSEPQAAAPAEKVGPLHGTETVLVIEDIPAVRQFLQTLLQQHGYSVLLAADGKAGLDIFHRQAEEIDLILLDLAMPTMSGEEVLHALNGLEARPEVILFTGHNVDKAQFPSVAAILLKPVDSAVLVGTVREVLDR